MHGVATSLLCWTEVWSSFLVRTVSGKLSFWYSRGTMGSPLISWKHIGALVGRQAGLGASPAMQRASLAVQ